MTLAIRFRYFSATTPTFEIVELNDHEWREFFLLERSHQRLEWMLSFLHREYLRPQYKELWWIPLNDQDKLKITE